MKKKKLNNLLLVNLKMDIDKLNISLRNFFKDDIKINQSVNLSNDLNNYFEIYINDNISVSLI